MHCVAKSRSRRRFDLNGQQPTPVLYYKVDFLTGGRSPVEYAGPRRASVAPGQKVVKDDIFKMAAGGSRTISQIERNAGVAPIEFGCLDQPLLLYDTVNLRNWSLTRHIIVRYFVRHENSKCAGTTAPSKKNT